MLRCFFLTLVLLGVTSDHNTDGSDNKSLAPATLLSPLKIEYVGRFIGKKGSFATLRAGDLERRYTEGESISGTDVSIYRITPSEVIVEKNGVYFAIPFFSSKVLEKKESKESSASPSRTRCLNVNFSKDLIEKSMNGLITVLQDHPEGVLISEDLGDFNLLGLSFKKGDVIVAIDKQKTANRKKVFQMMQKFRQGVEGPLTVRFIRDGREQSVIYSIPRRRSS